MKTQCPTCHTEYDIAESKILSWAASIHGKRSRRELTREEAQRIRAIGTEKMRKRSQAETEDKSQPEGGTK